MKQKKEESMKVVREVINRKVFEEEQFRFDDIAYCLKIDKKSEKYE
jgi:hypothetical protein